MTKVLMVIAPKDFRDAEYFEPKKVFEENGFEITTASKIIGKIAGVDGGEASSSTKITDADPANFDAVVFSGGPGMVPLVDDSEFKKLANEFYKSDKLTAGICAAAAILANAGLLQGKRATGWSGIVNLLKSGGAVYEGKSVEVDGKLVTADGPQVAKEFGEKIVELLKN